MAIQIQGNGGTVADVDGTVYRAMRTTLRPLDYGAFGAYRMSLLSGTMAAGLAGNSEIFQFRWTDATRLCVVTSVVFDGLSGSATAFAAGFGKVDMMAARSWTADGSGGSAATITGNNQKQRTSMGTTLLGAARVASTAALGAGTKTLDSQALGQYSAAFGTGTSVQWIPQFDLFHLDPGGESPLILAQNEGFVVRATVPATGTWQFGVTVCWTEVASY
jgi:hypothetical protein